MPVTPLLAGDPERLGEHVLAGRLGSGGMGTVYLGRSPDGRRVAIKVVRPEQAADPRFLARFHSEVRRARQVPPFCTAAVLHDDLEHDPPYLVVEYVDGPSLAEVIRENGPLPPSEAYAVSVGVATALVAIHGAGVVHRDLKPANVLLAVGLPKVIDFGIARGTDLSAELTGPDHVVGTIGYLAPECLDTDRRGRVGPPADVFAWGVLVGFAATGRTPFGGESPLATIGRILTQPPDLDGVPEPLRRLAAAALEKDPVRRPTANELLDALLSAGRPDMTPELRRVALAAQAGNRRTRRWLGRAAAVLVAGLLVAAGVAVARSSDEVVRQDRALVQRDLLDRSAKALETDPGLALRLAVSAETVSPSDRGRAAIDAALATGYEGELNPDEAVYTTEFRPDGAMVAAAGAGDVGLWSVQGTRFTRVGTLATAGQETTDLSFSPDGRTIATAGARLQLWDTAGAYPLAELTGQAWDGVQFSGDRLLTVADRLELWDVRDRAHPRSVWSAPAGTATRGGARLSADGRLLAGVAEGELLTVWAVDGTPRRLAVINDADAVINLAFSPDGKRLAAATVSDGVRLYDLADPARPRLLSTFAADGGTATTVAFDRTGTLLAVGSEQRTVGLWSVAEPARPQPLRTLRRDGGWISSIDFTPDGHRLLIAGRQGTARSAALWRVTPFAPVQRSRIDAAPDPIRLVGVSSTDVLAVAAPDGGRVEFWDLRDPSRPVPARPGFTSSSGASRVRPSTGLLFANGSVYDLSGNDPRRLLAGVVDADPDRGLAAVLRDGERVLIYRLAAGAEPIPLAEIPAAYLAAVVFDQVTGQVVIADDNGGAESALTVWDLTAPVPRRVAVLAAQGGVQALEARAGTVVTVDRNVVTWAAGTVRSAPRPGNRVAGVGAVTLSADGTLLAITGRSGTELWSLPPGADPLLVAVLPGEPTSAAFSPRGPLLAVGDPGGTTVWDVSALQMTLSDPHSEACLRQGGLTSSEWAGQVPTLRYEPACS
ncbi:serine/threonine-protein kinase [Actinoplanes sichuanensis]|uniref:Serine/threonine-protein kinase n=1 Tax=Actinoplanes sichuanensis TaxID=512349 RepID=A0ABW4ASE0_9ACTN|nr:serine/threonine-protein kinase [Actinoplanes sichuanensis]